MPDDKQQGNPLQTALDTGQAIRGAVEAGKAISNIARGAAAGGPYGAAVEAAIALRKPIAITLISLLAIPILFIFMLPQIIYDGLDAATPDGEQPILNNSAQIVENISSINQEIAAVLARSHEKALDEAQRLADRHRYSEVRDSSEEVVYDANQVICWYSAMKDKAIHEISIPDLVALLSNHEDRLYTYEITKEDRTYTVEVPDDSEEGYHEEEETITYTIYTVKYVGNEYFNTHIFILDEKQTVLASEYAANLTMFLFDSYEMNANGTHNEIGNMTGDDDTELPDDGSFGSPFPGTDWRSMITSGFGGRPYPGVGSGTSNHTGLDIGRPAGTTIHAVMGGTVLFVKDSGASGYGKHVAISHGGGYVTLYAHCSAILVNTGQQVEKGEAVARVGQTGWATGNHLHIEVIIDGKPVNPIGYLE